MRLAQRTGLPVRERRLVPKRVVQGGQPRVAATDTGCRRSDRLFRILRIPSAVATRFGVALFSALTLAPVLANPPIDEALTQARPGVAHDSTAPVISGGTAPYTFTLNEAFLPRSLYTGPA